MSQPINVNVQTGAGEVIRIVATLLLFGGAGALAWAVAQQGYAELAGTGLTVMTVQVIKMMWVNGLIGLPARGSGSESADPDITGIKSFVAANYRVLMRYQAESPAPRMVAIGFAYAVGFLILRAGMINALTVFHNIIIAGGAAAILGSIVVMPKLLPTAFGRLKSKGVVRSATGQPTAPPPDRTEASPTARVPAAHLPPNWPGPIADYPMAPAPRPPARIVIRKKQTEDDTHA